MPIQDTSRRLSPDVITQDIQSLNGLKAIQDYQSIRSEASLDALQTAYQFMMLQKQLLTERQAAYKATADSLKQSEWAFHNAVLAMKESVRGQYGSDSNQVQTVGFKRKSNRKRPAKARVVVTEAIE
jgi:hypothetical protein